MSAPNPCPLHIFVAGAEKLTRKDIFGICDPYVQVTLSSPNQQQNMVFRTKTIKKSLNPVWKERFEFPRVNPKEHYVIFEVYDEHRVTKDNCIGGIKVKLSDHRIECKKTNIAGDSTKLMNAPLHKRNAGSKSKIMGQLQFKLLFFADPVGQPRQLDLGTLVVGASGRDRSPSSRGGNVGTPPRRSSQDQSPSGAVAMRRQTSSSSTSGQSQSRGASSSQLPRQSSRTNWMQEEELEPLPHGWEERQDGQGRTFYIDHLNRRTQWDRPTRSAASATEAVQRQQDLEMRHFTMRRQVGDRSGGPNGGGRDVGGAPSRMRSQSSNQDSPVMRSNSQTSHGRSGQQDSPLLRSGPQEPGTNTPTSPLHRAVGNQGDRDRSSTRRDPPVEVEELTLPPGWEKRSSPDGRVFYVNHNTRSTHWDHPGKGEMKRTPSKSKSVNYKDMTPEQLEKELGPLQVRTVFVVIVMLTVMLALICILILCYLAFILLSCCSISVCYLLDVVVVCLSTIGRLGNQKERQRKILLCRPQYSIDSVGGSQDCKAEE
jgi:hypothetical protein